MEGFPASAAAGSSSPGGAAAGKFDQTCT
jgi:hypothetical protein